MALTSTPTMCLEFLAPCLESLTRGKNANLFPERGAEDSERIAGDGAVPVTVENWGVLALPGAEADAEVDLQQCLLRRGTFVILLPHSRLYE